MEANPVNFASFSGPVQPTTIQGIDAPRMEKIHRGHKHEHDDDHKHKGPERAVHKAVKGMRKAIHFAMKPFVRGENGLDKESRAELREAEHEMKHALKDAEKAFKKGELDAAGFLESAITAIEDFASAFQSTIGTPEEEAAVGVEPPAQQPVQAPVQSPVEAVQDPQGPVQAPSPDPMQGPVDAVQDPQGPVQAPAQDPVSPVEAMGSAVEESIEEEAHDDDHDDDDFGTIRLQFAQDRMTGILEGITSALQSALDSIRAAEEPEPVEQPPQPQQQPVAPTPDPVRNPIVQDPATAMENLVLPTTLDVLA